MPPSLLFVFYSESVWALRTQLSPNDDVTYTKKMRYQGDRTHQTQWFPSFLVNLHSETLVFRHMQGCWDTHTKPFKFQDLHLPFADLLRRADRMIFKAFKISDPHNGCGLGLTLQLQIKDFQSQLKRAEIKQRGNQIYFVT